MIDTFESRHEQSRCPEYITESFRHLLEQGNPETSSCPFVQELKKVRIKDGEETKLRRIGRRIQWEDRNGGIGYLSSSTGHDRPKELLAAAYIAKCFSERKISTQAVVVPVDEFYRFTPGNSSLVGKTKIFNEVAEEQNPGQDFALILTGFTESDIFTQKVLEQVPTQNNAGLDIFKTTLFGKKLLKFATEQLPLIIEREKGDLNAVLKKIIGTQDGQEKNARLLLATGLLLQDRQAWQDLWYEGRKKGTPLYIVAPMSFHDAMNRLNLGWGHGGIDYSRRASYSLGDNNKPPLEEIELQNYHEQGVSAEEFERRIKPLLEK